MSKELRPHLRWWRFRSTVTLRSRRSWMRWRRMRLTRRLHREQRHLTVLRLQLQVQEQTVQALEQALHPQQVVVLPPPDPTPAGLAELIAAQPLPPEPEPTPEPELEPMPDPRLEIAQRLGLPQQRS